MVLHAFFRSELSYPELFARLPGRSYDALAFRASRRLGYRFSDLRREARWELINEEIPVSRE